MCVAARRYQERGERCFADEPEELRVHDPPPVEDDGAPPRRQRDEELAGLAPERDRLRDIRQVHDPE